MRAGAIPGLFGLVFLIVFSFAITAEAAQVNISIGDNNYTPKNVTVQPGDLVVWTNVGAMPHTVTADNSSFDSGTLQIGQKYSIQFTDPGYYPYFCKLHTGMTGSITVQGVYSQTQTTQTTQTQTGVGFPPAYTTTSGSGATAQSLTAQAQTLLAKIIALQQQLAAGGSTSFSSTGAVPPGANCPRTGGTLKVGSSGEDVTRLQEYLARDPSIYPEARVTGYYGALTQKAIERWQTKYNIVSSGTPETTGFGQVGPRTAAAIALQCSGSSGSPSIPPSTGPAGGFIQVTPISGNAPLTVSVQATVNTVSSCAAALYLLDWGDGTPSQAIHVTTGTCAQVSQTYTHIYNYGGSYTIKLSSGSHETKAIVTITGPQAPAPMTGMSVTSPLAGQNVFAGTPVSIAWQSLVAMPAGGQIALDLYSGAGQKVAANDLIALTAYPSGTLEWIVPSGGSSSACPAIYPGRLCGTNIPTGSYKIRATLHQPSISGNTLGAAVASGESGIFTIIASTSTPSSSSQTSFVSDVVSGQAPLSVTFSGVVTNTQTGCTQGCTATLDFGDGTTGVVLLPQAQGATRNFTAPHTYHNAGTFTATLYKGQRGAGQPTFGSITITVAGDPSDSFNYTPMAIQPGTAGNPHSVTVVFDLPTTCTGFRLSWGDGSSDIVQNHRTNCAQSPVTQPYTHAYTSPGAYEIILERGANYSRQDSIGVEIVD